MIFYKPMGRTPYFTAGVLLLALKYNLDRAIASLGFHRSWFFWNYIEPRPVAGIEAVPPPEHSFYFVLLLTSLPFLFVGLILTLRRLKSAALPLPLCLLFFVPVVNLVFFVVLSVIPERPAPGSESLPLPRGSWLPTGAVESALTSTLLVSVAGLGLVLLSINYLQNYGWGLFVALPFALGLVSVLLYAGREPRSLKSCLVVSIMPLGFIGLGMFFMAFEGLICLFMALPIAAILALAGGFVGYLIVGNRRAPLPPSAITLILASVPFWMGMEYRAGVPPPLLSVTSSVIVNAPPEKVWPYVIEFPPISEDRGWILRTGVAYPTRARIVGRGVGSIRHCIFSTGEFVEPVEVWDEPNLLKFSVAMQPEPMKELSPYPHIKTTHLDGYFLSHEGQIKLTPLPGGRTLLEGTTWYTDRIWPTAYWQIWSDYLIHEIHLRVLRHIKALAET